MARPVENPMDVVRVKLAIMLFTGICSLAEITGERVKGERRERDRIERDRREGDRRERDMRKGERREGDMREGDTSYLTKVLESHYLA